MEAINLIAFDDLGTFWPLPEETGLIRICGKTLVERAIEKLYLAGFREFRVILKNPKKLRVPLPISVEVVVAEEVLELDGFLLRAYDLFAIEFLASNPKLRKSIRDSEGILRISVKGGEESSADLRPFRWSWNLLDILSEFLSDIPSFKHPEAYVDDGARIIGRVYVGKGAKILAGATIVGPAYIGEGTIIGNSSLVRESVIERHSIVGARIEVARSIFLEGAETHSGYVGDSILSYKAHLGAEVVTANMRLDRNPIKAKTPWGRLDTGRTKLGAIVGERAEVGVNVSIMPGVLIGRRARIWPNRVVMDCVKDDEIFQ